MSFQLYSFSKLVLLSRSTLRNKIMAEPLMSHWLFFMMSILRFWTLNVIVPLLSTQGQKALGFRKKYLNLCPKWRSYGFGTTWRWVINDRNFNFGWTIPLISTLWIQNVISSSNSWLCCKPKSNGYLTNRMNSISNEWKKVVSTLGV